MSLTQKRKRYLAEWVTNETCFAKKISEILGKTHSWKSLCRSLFLGCRFAPLSKKILRNTYFPVNGCNNLWTVVSDLGKYPTIVTIIFDSVENIWNFGVWSNLNTVVREHDVSRENCFPKIFQEMSKIFK